MEGGWIKLFRKLLKSLIWQHPELCRLFIWCLLRANWSDVDLFFGSCANPIKLGRGQFVTGRQAMHSEMYPKNSKKNPTAVTVYAQLKILRGMGLVELKSNNQYTIVTVAMFDTYQTLENDDLATDCQQSVNGLSTDCQRIVTDKNKQEKKEQGRIRKKAPQAAVVFPNSLDTVEFREVYSKWVEYRSQMKKKLTPMMISSQLEMLADKGTDAAIAMIKHTMAMTWQGLREPDVAFSGGAGASKPKPPNVTAEDLL